MKEDRKTKGGDERRREEKNERGKKGEGREDGEKRWVESD